mmetsp:Transcript_17852/g.36421  ORF Transcript_17852/g.36421 Transcript_17852/m.36421 type:complete len:216 (+) Transcript_17852:319-966(+)
MTFSTTTTTTTTKTTTKKRRTMTTQTTTTDTVSITTPHPPPSTPRSINTSTTNPSKTASSPPPADGPPPPTPSEDSWTPGRPIDLPRPITEPTPLDRAYWRPPGTRPISLFRCETWKAMTLFPLLLLLLLRTGRRLWMRWGNGQWGCSLLHGRYIVGHFSSRPLHKSDAFGIHIDHFLWSSRWTSFSLFLILLHCDVNGFELILLCHTLWRRLCL